MPEDSSIQTMPPAAPFAEMVGTQPGKPNFAADCEDGFSAILPPLTGNAFRLSLEPQK